MRMLRERYKKPIVSENSEVTQKKPSQKQVSEQEDNLQEPSDTVQYYIEEQPTSNEQPSYEIVYDNQVENYEDGSEPQVYDYEPIEVEYVEYDQYPAEKSVKPLDIQKQVQSEKENPSVNVEKVLTLPAKLTNQDINKLNDKLQKSTKNSNKENQNIPSYENMKNYDNPEEEYQYIYEDETLNYDEKSNVELPKPKPAKVNYHKEIPYVPRQKQQIADISPSKTAVDKSVTPKIPVKSEASEIKKEVPVVSIKKPQSSHSHLIRKVVHKVRPVTPVKPNIKNSKDSVKPKVSRTKIRKIIPYIPKQSSNITPNHRPKQVVQIPEKVVETKTKLITSSKEIAKPSNHTPPKPKPSLPKKVIKSNQKSHLESNHPNMQSKNRPNIKTVKTKLVEKRPIHLVKKQNHQSQSQIVSSKIISKAKPIAKLPKKKPVSQHKVETQKLSSKSPVHIKVPEHNSKINPISIPIKQKQIVPNKNHAINVPKTPEVETQATKITSSTLKNVANMNKKPINHNSGIKSKPSKESVKPPLKPLTPLGHAKSGNSIKSSVRVASPPVEIEIPESKSVTLQTTEVSDKDLNTISPTTITPDETKKDDKAIHTKEHELQTVHNYLRK